jgi:tRNA dimethylallyltransferase
MTCEHLAILGPTCSWKTETAVVLAERLGLDVLNCDSMQVYRGMDIGTGKPPAADRERIRHLLLDCLDISQRCDVSTYVALAEKALCELEGRGRRAVLAGGTGLYARSLIYGMHRIPADPQLAGRLGAEFRSPGGREALLGELLRSSDAADVPPDVLANPRRLLRAIEVLRLTGATPWALRRAPLPAADRRFRQYIVLPDLAILKSRIAQRTSEWLGHGWVDEVHILLARGFLQTPTARQALGYADIAAFLCGEVRDLAELHERISRATVGYARRQCTWFRHQHPGAIAILVRRPTSAAELAESILADLARPRDGRCPQANRTLTIA